MGLSWVGDIGKGDHTRAIKSGNYRGSSDLRRKAAGAFARVSSARVIRARRCAGQKILAITISWAERCSLTQQLLPGQLILPYHCRYETRGDLRGTVNRTFRRIYSHIYAFDALFRPHLCAFNNLTVYTRPRMLLLLLLGHRQRHLNPMASSDQIPGTHVYRYIHIYMRLVAWAREIHVSARVHQQRALIRADVREPVYTQGHSVIVIGSC